MAQPIPLPKSVGGFTPIPVSYTPSVTHILYARAHSNTNNSKRDDKGKGKEVAYPEGRTLFLVNVPPDATEREVTLFFKPAGTVERVVFDWDNEGASEEHLEESDTEDEGGADAEGEADAASDAVPERPRKKRKTAKGEDTPPQVTPLPAPALRTLRRTGRTAHVVFLDASSLARAASPPSPPQPRPWPADDDAPTGFAHYLAVYAALRPPLDSVRAHADSYMAHFEWAQARERRQSKYKMGEAIVDEDGFTLVTRGGAYGKTLGGGVGVASKTFQEEQAGKVTGGGGGKRYRKKTKRKEEDSFYAFQIHEKKRKELMDLKAKWEEDKAKVERLKHSRRFKPY